jgi:hypothetical protein
VKSGVKKVDKIYLNSEVKKDIENIKGLGSRFLSVLEKGLMYLAAGVAGKEMIKIIFGDDDGRKAT